MDTKEKIQKEEQRKRRPPQVEQIEHTTRKRKNVGETPRPLQDVVYMPPKPFVRNRIILRLVTIAAIVVALVLAMSVFFRVEQVEVSGCIKYQPNDIKQASGIENGNSLFSLGLPGAAARIKALPYVKDVRIGIKLPNTVQIEIVEVRVTYAMKAENEEWWLIDSGGRIVEKLSQEDEGTYTKILGVHLQKPQVGQQAVAQEVERSELDENGNPIPVTVTAAYQLSVALRIADTIESYGILGQAASIDVNDVGNIQMWYGQQYQIKFGDDNLLEQKIRVAKSAIDQLSAESHNSGVLDATFTVDKTGVIYKRFQ